MKLLVIKEIKKHLRKTNKETNISKNAFDELNSFSCNCFHYVFEIVKEIQKNGHELFTYNDSISQEEKIQLFRLSLQSKEKQKLLEEWFIPADNWYKSHMEICSEHNERSFSFCSKIKTSFIDLEETGETIGNKYILFFISHGINTIIEWILDICIKLIETTNVQTLKREDIILVLSKATTLKSVYNTETEKPKNSDVDLMISKMEKSTIEDEREIRVCVDSKTTWIGIPRVKTEGGFMKTESKNLQTDRIKKRKESIVIESIII